ncbi:septum site-determining protein Ssd [Stackebrandtia soli]|uniref:septum site-determining protein Ssd n=1 Tax=Stackebrandtia soli TaxID=1892856 RepID=UPI0039E9AA32
MASTSLDRPSGRHCPLFVTADAAVLTELERLATVAGVDHRSAVDPTEAARHWLSASLVVIGADVATAVADARLPVRDGLVLLTGADLPYDRAWPLALAMGVDQVASLPESSGWFCDRLVPTARLAEPPVIAVIGAGGGAGASTLASTVSLVSARRGVETTLIDADTQGGGLDLALGWESVVGLRWPSLTDRLGPIDRTRWRDCLPHRNGLAVLSAEAGRPVAPSAITMAAVIDVSRRTSELTIVDVPRYGGIAATRPADLLVVVVSAEVRAVAAARSVIAQHSVGVGNVGIVVRRSASGWPAGRDIAEVLRVPLLGELPEDRRVPRLIESGRFGVRACHTALVPAAEAILAEVVPGTRKAREAVCAA